LTVNGMNDEVIELDGALGEGGGQILRTSLTLSLLTGKPFHLKNIRAGRSKPGLQPQHLASVRAAGQIGQAQVLGDQIGSRELHFEPGPIVAGKYHFGIGTAGATSLVLQTIYLPLALKGDRPSEIVITGGTHVKASPSFHFLDATWKAYLERMGLPLALQMRQPGFYPRGGGVIQAHVEPVAHIAPLRLADFGHRFHRHRGPAAFGRRADEPPSRQSPAGRAHRV
jgi:RNA 3'-terminal phosphate cyclase (ATP)